MVMDLQSFFTSLLNVVCEMAPYLLLGVPPATVFVWRDSNGYRPEASASANTLTIKGPATEETIQLKKNKLLHL